MCTPTPYALIPTLALTLIAKYNAAPPPGAPRPLGSVYSSDLAGPAEEDRGEEGEEGGKQVWGFGTRQVEHLSVDTSSCLCQGTPNCSKALLQGQKSPQARGWLGIRDVLVGRFSLGPRCFIAPLGATMASFVDLCLQWSPLFRLP